MVLPMSAEGWVTRHHDSDAPPSSRTERQLELVLALGRATAEARDLEGLVDQALDLAIASLDADAILLHERRGDDLVLLGHALKTGSFSGEVQAELARYAVTSDTLAGRAARSGALVIASENEWPSACSSLAGRLGVQFGAAAPLLAGRRVVGTLVALRFVSRPLTRHQLRLLETLAAQLGSAIEHLRLLDEERKRATDLAAVQEFGRLVGEPIELDRVLAVAARHLANLAGGVNVFLSLVEGDVLRMRSTSLPEHAGMDIRLPLSNHVSVATTSVATRRTILVADVEHDPRVDLALAQRFHHRSILSIPLFARGAPIGCVTLGLTREGAVFSERDVASAEAIGNQLALAIANAQLVDDLKRSFDELADAQRTLVERERLAALGELSAVIAHEVRNPLAIIWNSLGTLRHKLQPTGDVATLLDIVREESDRLNRLVSDLLDYARPNLAELRRSELAPLIRDAVEAARTASDDSQVQVLIDVPDGLPHVLADARLLRQALVNLVINAVQAMPDGGVVTLVAVADREARTVRIDVADQGEGLSPEAHARLFEPFFTTKATGTGLGLMLVKRIVDAHGGEVVVAARAERGTIFSLRLPIALASVSPPELD